MASITTWPRSRTSQGAEHIARYKSAYSTTVDVNNGGRKPNDLIETSIVIMRNMQGMREQANHASAVSVFPNSLSNDSNKGMSPRL